MGVEKTTEQGDLCSVFLIKYLGDQIKKTKMRRACLLERRGASWVLVGKPEGRRPLGKLRLVGRIILKWIFDQWFGVGGY